MRSVVDRKVVKRHMTIHDHSTENNYISIQFLYFTSRNTQYTQRHDSTNFLHRGKDDAVYTTLNTQSGPVHLSCPPECRRLSQVLTGEQPVRTSKGFSRVIYYTWAAAGGCEMFFRMVICSTCCKMHSSTGYSRGAGGTG